MKTEEIEIGMEVVYFNPLPQRSIVQKAPFVEDGVGFVKIKGHRSPVCTYQIEEYRPGHELLYSFRAIEYKILALKSSFHIDKRISKYIAGELVETVNHFVEMLDKAHTKGRDIALSDNGQPTDNE